MRRQGITRPAPLKKRTTYDPSFKLHVVREALLRPVDNRIKPTCARYPGIEPCQLRKWIRNLESEARATGDGSSSDARMRPRMVPSLTKEPAGSGRKVSLGRGGGSVRRSSRPRKPSARANDFGEECCAEDDDDEVQHHVYDIEDGEKEFEDSDDDGEMDGDLEEERLHEAGASASHTPMQMMFGVSIFPSATCHEGSVLEEIPAMHHDSLIDAFCLPEPMMAMKSPHSQSALSRTSVNSPEPQDDDGVQRQAHWFTLCTPPIKPVEALLTGTPKPGCVKRGFPVPAQDAYFSETCDRPCVGAHGKSFAKPHGKPFTEVGRPLSMVSSTELTCFAMGSGSVVRGGASILDDVPHDQWFAEWLSQVTEE